METGPQEHKMSQIQGDGGDGRGSKWHALGVCRMAGCHTPACPGVGMGVGGGGGGGGGRRVGVRGEWRMRDGGLPSAPLILLFLFFARSFIFPWLLILP